MDQTDKWLEQDELSLCLHSTVSILSLEKILQCFVSGRSGSVSKLLTSIPIPSQLNERLQYEKTSLASLGDLWLSRGQLQRDDVSLVSKRRPKSLSHKVDENIFAVRAYRHENDQARWLVQNSWHAFNHEDDEECLSGDRKHLSENMTCTPDDTDDEDLANLLLRKLNLDISNAPANVEIISKVADELLLVTDTGYFENEVVCHLVPIQRVHAAQKYYALSYVWTDDRIFARPSGRADSKLICNGQMVSVSSNLVRALKRVRRSTNHRIVWVDQLCINQADEEEKTQQVQTMNSIYSASQQAIIWLGTGLGGCEDELSSHYVRQVLDTICRLVNQWDPSEKASYWIRNDQTRVYDQFYSGGHVEKICEDELRTIRDFFREKWFTRRWVIQEAALAPSAMVYWSQSKICWRHVGLAAAVLRTSHDKLLRHINLPEVYDAYFVFRLSKQEDLPPLKLSFIHLLRLSQGFNVTEPKDAIFALLGIATTDNDPYGSRFTEADYSINISQLLINVAEKLLTQPRPLSLLSNAGLEHHYWSNHKGLPSWVPTWSQSKICMLNPWIFNHAFRPATGLDFRRWDSLNVLNLAVDGIQVSTIAWTDMVMWDGGNRPTTRLCQLLSRPAFRPLNQSILELFARTLCASRDIYGAKDDTRDLFAHDFAAFLSKCNPEKHKGDKNSCMSYNPTVRQVAEGGLVSRFIAVSNLVCEGRRIFFTTGGHLGLGPAVANPGDIIVVFGGAKMPFVLRKTEGLVQLVGECYVDDIMNGEVVGAMQKGETHRGIFDPRKLIESLFWFNNIRGEGQDLIRSTVNDCLTLSAAEYKVLKVQRFDIS